MYQYSISMLPLETNIYLASTCFLWKLTSNQHLHASSGNKHIYRISILDPETNIYIASICFLWKLIRVRTLVAAPAFRTPRCCVHHDDQRPNFPWVFLSHPRAHACMQTRKHADAYAETLVSVCICMWDLCLSVIVGTD